MDKPRKTKVIERVLGYIKIEDDEQIVFRLKLPDGKVEDRVFNRNVLPERQEGVSSIFLEIKTIVRWLPIPQEAAKFKRLVRRHDKPRKRNQTE